MATVLPFFCFLVCVLGDPIVEGDLGTVTGTIQNILDVDIEAFLGIPYARPPLDDLRFALPVAFGAVGEFEATKYGALCPQPNTGPMAKPDRVLKEDCLFLNVFRKRGTSRNDRKAVIATIHGGGYVGGSSSEASLSAASLSAVGDVIVVSFNYRLGILGFAEMNGFAPGNLGLHDQRLALQWIQDHITDFGGDPGRVTVIGVSAGSMSLAAQIITPIDDKNLFQSAVLDAGVVTSDGFFEDAQSSYARLRKIAERVGCPVDSQKMVDCLRKVSVDALIAPSMNTTGNNGISYFVASADGIFIPYNVEEYVEKNSANIRKIRTIIGYAKDEGSFFVGTKFLSFDMPNLKTKDDVIKHCEILSTNYNHELDFTNERTRQLIGQLYADEHQSNPIQAVAAFQADGTFKCPTNTFVRSLARHNDEVYVYQFDRKLQATYWNGFLNPEQFGAFHFSPYLHFVGVLLVTGDPIDLEDKLYSLDAVNMIANFAKLEDAPTFRGLKWPSFSDSGEMLILDETPRLRRGLSSERNCRELFDSADEASAEVVRNEL